MHRHQQKHFETAYCAEHGMGCHPLSQVVSTSLDESKCSLPARQEMLNRRRQRSKAPSRLNAIGRFHTPAAVPTARNNPGLPLFIDQRRLCPLRNLDQVQQILFGDGHMLDAFQHRPSSRSRDTHGHVFRDSIESINQGARSNLKMSQNHLPLSFCHFCSACGWDSLQPLVQAMVSACSCCRRRPWCGSVGWRQSLPPQPVRQRWW